MDAECTFEEACYRETQKVSKTILQSLKEITDKWPLENKLSKEISEKLLFGYLLFFLISPLS